jgi:hypothetical protein
MVAQSGTPNRSAHVALMSSISHALKGGPEHPQTKTDGSLFLIALAGKRCVSCLIQQLLLPQAPVFVCNCVRSKENT